MSTKNKSKTDALANAEQLAADYAEAQKVLDRLTSEHEAAQEAVEAIRDAWAGGDSTPSADDLTTAEAEAERLDTLREAARRKANRLEGRQVNLDLRLAEVVATAVGRLYGERVPVRATVWGDDCALGEVIAVSRKAPEGTGALMRGEVLLTFRRDPLWAALDGERIVSALKHDSVIAEIGRTRTSGVGDEHTDSLTVKVHRAVPAVVRTSDPSGPGMLLDWGRTLQQVALRSVQRPSNGVEQVGAPRGWHASISDQHSELVSSEVDANGQRATVVKWFARVRPYDAYPGSGVPAVRAALVRLEDVVDPHLGKVHSIEISTPEDRHATDARVTVITTFTSQAA